MGHQGPAQTCLGNRTVSSPKAFKPLLLAVVDIHLDLEAGSLVGLVVGSLAAPAAGSPAGADSPVGPVADSPAVVGNLPRSNSSHEALTNAINTVLLALLFWPGLAVEEAAGIAEVAAADNLAAEAAAAAADSLSTSPNKAHDLQVRS